MRKQTKLVAVLSAAALLAIGASMTSFAGWEKNDDGTWSFTKNNETITGEWEKDGNKWFHLDDDGIMETDTWVDDLYYVGNDGAMIVNDWKKLADNTDVADPEDEGEHWYYFDSKGKKIDSKSKKIGGKTYYFDTDGKMKDGWYPTNSEIVYLGGEDEGGRASGWLWLSAPDISDVSTHSDSGVCGEKICDDEGWYYFNTSNGTMFRGEGRKKINGKYYYFNKHGQMLYEWIDAADEHTPTASYNNADGNFDGVASSASASNMVYANDVEEGWRADGWYQVDGSKSTGKNDDTSWYYFKNGKAKKAAIKSTNIPDLVITSNKDGKVYRTKEKIKASKNSYFCFDEVGQMQTGLQAVGNDVNVKFYYFDENGYMKSGKNGEVEEDDNSFYYMFSNKNGDNGAGITAVRDGYLYWNGKRLEADDDYKIYAFTNGEYYLVNNKGKVQKSATKDYNVENWKGGSTQENIKFTFNGDKVATYSVKVGDKYQAPLLFNGQTAADTAEIPEIKLYDKTYRMDQRQGARVGAGTWN